MGQRWIPEVTTEHERKFQGNIMSYTWHLFQVEQIIIFSEFPTFASSSLPPNYQKLILANLKKLYFVDVTTVNFEKLPGNDPMTEIMELFILSMTFI